MAYRDLKSFKLPMRYLSQLRRLWPCLWTTTRWIAIALLVIAGATAVLAVWAKLVDWDVESRLSEMQTAPPMFSLEHPNPELRPTIRLTLHRILQDENAIEASANLSFSRQFADYLKGQRTQFLIANIHDGTGLTDYLVEHSVKVEADSSETGGRALLAETPRFQLPFYPSLDSFPFDKTVLLVVVDVKDPGNYIWLDNTIEVVTTVPGREMSLSNKSGSLEIDLARLPSEKIFVVVGASVFFILSLVIFFAIISKKDSLSGVDGTVAVAGFILAASGFRDLLGVPKETGPCLLEIAVFGIPFILIVSAVLYAMPRSYWLETNEDSSERESKER
jgi:hypothetical protein